MVLGRQITETAGTPTWQRNSIPESLMLWFHFNSNNSASSHITAMTRMLKPCQMVRIVPSVMPMAVFRKDQQRCLPVFYYFLQRIFMEQPVPDRVTLKP